MTLQYGSNTTCEFSLRIASRIEFGAKSPSCVYNPLSQHTLKNIIYGRILSVNLFDHCTNILQVFCDSAFCFSAVDVRHHAVYHTRCHYKRTFIDPMDQQKWLSWVRYLERSAVHVIVQKKKRKSQFEIVCRFYWQAAYTHKNRIM